MKKIFVFAAAVAMLAACSSEELNNAENTLQKPSENPINFSIYTPRSVTRGGVAKEMNTGTMATSGFGILAYYTDDERYDAENSKPNYMYNTKVTSADAGVTWVYEPVMYWPNEYGSNATSDFADFVSFFAYAPYVDVEPTTGVPTGATENEKGITSISKNNAGGDPIVKYIVDTQPSKSVDLLWGAAADNSSSPYYTPINTTLTPAVTITKDMPFIDLIKPANPTTDKLNFVMYHALSKLNVDIRYEADNVTPGSSPSGVTIGNTTTRIYVRSVKIGGFVMKGALNLHNTAPRTPNWKAYNDGETSLVTGDVTFYDGRKDGKEGTSAGDASGETPIGLNPNIIENYSTVPWATGVWSETNTTYKTSGVTGTAVNLFKGASSATAASEPIFVIPTKEPINIEIVYDVETIDENLSTFLSDGVTHGSTIENRISKTSQQIFKTTADVNMTAGLGYTIHIILGMTSVKFDASVTPWTEGGTSNVNLPQN